ncbi:MAG: hypothetical protein HY094_10115 [Candidatus Melainabacteria bacterium]|nr:hypothetical protein [Candidatus Melainabacteria bacterium]
MGINFRAISGAIKLYLPTLIGNQLPTVYKIGDKIYFTGKDTEDLPRYPNTVNSADTSFVCGDGVKLTYKGWSYGYYSNDGNFHKSNNPLNEVYYRFEGALIALHSFEPYEKKSDDLIPDVIQSESLDPIEQVCKNELGIPDSFETSYHPDILPFNSEPLTKHADTNKITDSNGQGEYINTFDGSKRGTFRLYDGEFYIAESIVLERIASNRSWSLVQRNKVQEDPIITKKNKAA